MTTRTTPTIDQSTPTRSSITRSAVDDYLTRRGKKLTNKRARKRARARLTKREEKQNRPRGADVSFTQANASWQYIYGTMRVGGVINFIQSHERKSKLSQIITVASHQINEVIKAYVDGEEVPFGASPDPRWSIAPFATNAGVSLVFMDTGRKGTLDQQASPDLIAQMNANPATEGLWTSAHRLAGHAHVYMIFRYNAIRFSEGMPETAFLVEGKVVFDPRNNTTAFSSNAALCILDFLTDSKIGIGIDYSKIDEASFIAAANICDQDVPLVAGGTEKRYTINASFTSDQSKSEILEEMFSACDGRLTYSGGKYRLVVRAYTPATLTLTCLLYTSPSPRDATLSRMPSSA